MRRPTLVSISGYHTRQNQQQAWLCVVHAVKCSNFAYLSCAYISQTPFYPPKQCNLILLIATALHTTDILPRNSLDPLYLLLPCETLFEFQPLLEHKLRPSLLHLTLGQPLIQFPYPSHRLDSGLSISVFLSVVLILLGGGGGGGAFLDTSPFKINPHIPALCPLRPLRDQTLEDSSSSFDIAVVTLPFQSRETGRQCSFLRLVYAL